MTKATLIYRTKVNSKAFAISIYILTAFTFIMFDMMAVRIGIEILLNSQLFYSNSTIEFHLHLISILF